MEETLITFETAKLAKEKGFNEHTLCFYFEGGEFRENKLKDTFGYYGEEYTVEYEELLNNWNDGFVTKKDGSRCFGCNKSGTYFETFSAPTQSLLIKWLREKHNLFIKIDFFQSDEFEELDFDFSIFDLTNPFKEDGVTDNPIRDYIDTETYFFKYEEALEAALLEALLLI